MFRQRHDRTVEYDRQIVRNRLYIIDMADEYGRKACKTQFYIIGNLMYLNEATRGQGDKVVFPDGKLS